MNSRITYDVAIIGAGITGACIARELAKTSAKIALIEKENDVACGSSKANSAIVHGGFDPVPGTLMARLNVRGSELYPELAKKLNFDYENNGSLVIAFDEQGRALLNTLLERGRKNGVKDLRIVESEELHDMEPNLGDNSLAALYSPTAGIMCPYKATWAFAESAVINGAEFFRNTAVHAIEKTDGVFVLRTGHGEIRAKYVVNAAGIFADKVSAMAGARKFVIKQRRGEYCLLDNNCKSLVNHTLFQTPTALGKGVLVTQTVDGNILIGPSADDQSGDMDGYTGTTAASQADVLAKASLTIPDIPRGNIINSFAGIRAIACETDENGNAGESIEDFIIEEDANVKGFINASGICSPGLSAAPATAEYVAELLKSAGLDVKKRDDFIEERKGITAFHTANIATRLKLIKEDPLYGQIICRCETVTEAEIVQAIRSPLGALDVDGIKRRTRAGMGRCQSGFCSPRVTEILSREAHIPMTSVTKKGGSSFMLAGKTRDFSDDESMQGAKR
ncbi:NAD(P)/FAD-dependent oxidoreductase [Treponema sp. Marseille-Q4130]|uniref:NAD(P)/FAD-dependent oxidoreductase n=1 Tax=Treponema sp. Marseille-Q4130 TaxID=2766702 RepID=UPI001651BD8C|nr:NAD(P)/FAD-dependent oxidoreductase [Treponema sp. Marseille-Q4130]MBC6718995.1 NAD(P)/FAD-dependent oxidoreductase [Treponema sp. Marseille-Q4130]